VADFYLAPYPCTDISESIETQLELDDVDDDYFFHFNMVINSPKNLTCIRDRLFPLLKHNSAVEKDMRILQ